MGGPSTFCKMSTFCGSVGHIRTNVVDCARRVTLSNARSFDPLFLSSHRIYSDVAPAGVSYSSNIVRAKLRINCLASRRHHRRRDGFGEPKMQPKDSESIDRVSYSRKGKGSEDKVVITLDVEEWSHRVADGVAGVQRAAKCSVDKVVRVSQEFAHESREAWKELRSSVRVQKDKRVVIAVKRSTADFAGKVLLWSILGMVFVKVLMKAMREYRWGWEEFSGPRRAVRDRSLGGREVLVGSGFKHREGGLEKRNSSSMQGVVNPLDGVERSRSEKILKGKRDREAAAAGLRTKATRLPGWWPGAFMPPSASIVTRQDAEEKAHSLMRGIMQKRLIGYDFAFEDMLELRQLCKTAGIKVKFDTPNTRDTFYRAAVTYVLTACCSAGDASVKGFGTEDGVMFIAGLAYNIGLEEDRAATMVNAAVAARTRAGFLQVRALQLQGKFNESEEELVKIIRVHSYFPPDPDSPEMELVARGLDSQFNREGKLELLDYYERMGGSKTRRVAEEALGLHLSS